LKASVLIRQEQEPDFGAVTEVTRVALTDSPTPPDGGLYHQALRRPQALSVSLVAELDGGWSANRYSPSPSRWHSGLVRVGAGCRLPEFQKQGIGSLLVEAGL
jgi:predicted N-acetyltransferase YhbS